MKQVLISVLIMLLMTVSYVGRAQYVKVSVGVKGGGIATMMASDPAPSDPMYFSGLGGAFVGLKIGNVLGVQGEFLYSITGGNYVVNSLPILLNQTYFQVPFILHVWAGRSVAFELGYQQSILMKATLTEQSSSPLSIDDIGAYKYYGSYLGGVTFNFGAVVFLNLRYTMSIKNAYMMYDKGAPVSTIQACLGFRLFNSKKSAFK